MLKKLSSILMVIFIGALGSSFYASGNSSSSWQNGEIKSIYISSGVSFEGAFNVGTETQKTLPDGKIIFTKKANIRGEFIKSPGDEVVLSSDLDVTFNYDKENAWIEEPTVDIVKKNRTINGTKWKVTSKEEVFEAPNQCIVAEQSELYKKEGWFNIRKTWKNVGNFHVDIVCQPSGDIKFNVESLNNMAQEVVVKDASFDEKVLSDGIIRRTKIFDKIYLQKNNEGAQLESDNYDYITRRMEISYVDPDKQEIASTVIEINFRYNPQTKEVECISTSHKEGEAVPKSDIDIYMRSGDKTRNSAGAYGRVRLDYKTKKISGSIDEAITVSCTNKAVITSKIKTD